MLEIPILISVVSSALHYPPVAWLLFWRLPSNYEGLWTACQYRGLHLTVGQIQQGPFWNILECHKIVPHSFLIKLAIYLVLKNLDDYNCCWQLLEDCFFSYFVSRTFYCPLNILMRTKWFKFGRRKHLFLFSNLVQLLCVLKSFILLHGI